MRTIIDMVQLTRLDCAIASAGIMRMALAAGDAPRAPSHRLSEALVDQPMMRAVLADMALEVEAATALVMRLARAFDRAGERSAARRPMRACSRRRRNIWSARLRRAHLRGHGVPRRQRLCRGERAAAALSRGAGQRDLGGLGQRDVPRRAARIRKRAQWRVRGAGRSCSRSGRPPWRGRCRRFIRAALSRAVDDRSRALRSAGFPCWRRRLHLRNVRRRSQSLFARTGSMVVMVRCLDQAILRPTRPRCCSIAPCRTVTTGARQIPAPLWGEARLPRTE